MRISRRELLKELGAAAVFSMFSRLGRSSTLPGTAPGIQLGWISNVEYAGEYVAQQNRFYTDQGIQPEFRPGGPEVDGISQLVSGKALCTLNNLVSVAHSISNGARLKVIAATFQKDPLTIISLPKSPLKTPKDIIGKRIGVSPAQYLFFSAFCKINQIDLKQVKIVPVGFDPAPLVTGQVDGFLSFLTNQPVALREQGIETEALVWADFGWNQFTNCFIVREDALADRTKREELVKVLRGTVLGWQEVIRDPDSAARLMVRLFGDRFGLKESTQINSARAEIPFIQTAETISNGLLTMSDRAIDACIESTRQTGVNIDRNVFCTELINEAVKGISRG